MFPNNGIASCLKKLSPVRKSGYVSVWWGGDTLKTENTTWLGVFPLYDFLVRRLSVFDQAFAVFRMTLISRLSAFFMRGCRFTSCSSSFAR